MGGDNAPGEIVKGAVEAVQKRNDIKISADRKRGSAEKGTGRLYVSCRTD